MASFSTPPPTMAPAQPVAILSRRTSTFTMRYATILIRPPRREPLFANRDTAVGRYRLDARINRPRPSHDTRCWVCPCFLSRRVHVQSGLGADALTHRFFYSGLARRKSALSLIWLCMMSVGVTSFQWFFWGYSLAFSHTAGRFIGDLSNIGFKDVLGRPSVGSYKIPDLMFAVYQGMFASITYVYSHPSPEWVSVGSSHTDDSKCRLRRRRCR